MATNKDTENGKGIPGTWGDAIEPGSTTSDFKDWWYTDLEQELLEVGVSRVVFPLEKARSEFSGALDRFLESKLTPDDHRKAREYLETGFALEVLLGSLSLKVTRLLLRNIPSQLGTIEGMIQETYEKAGIRTPADIDNLITEEDIDGSLEGLDSLWELVPNLPRDFWKWEVATSEMQERKK